MIRITTKRGDDGTTDLLFGERVAKDHPQIIACGDLDELNSALGLLRVHLDDDNEWKVQIRTWQRDLIALCGWIATPADKQAQYDASRLEKFTHECLARIDEALAKAEILGQDKMPKDWAIPGDDGLVSAHADLARTICRRAERSLFALASPEGMPLCYLNRMSDLLWWLGRILGHPAK